MAVLFDNGIFSVVGLNGDILPGSLLNWYASGTSTRRDTYSDAALIFPNDNPVEVDADGRVPPIYLQNAQYKMVLTDADGVVLVTRDPISGNPGGSSYNGLLAVNTLADIATFTPDVSQTYIYVLRYDNSSEVLPALYKQVGSNPNQALSHQDAAGNWWVNNEQFVDVRMAGAVAGSGANLKIAGERCSSLGRDVNIPAGLWNCENWTLSNPCRLHFLAGSHQTNYGNNTANSTTNCFLRILSDDVEIDGIDWNSPSSYDLNTIVGYPYYNDQCPVYTVIQLPRVTTGPTPRRRNFKFFNNKIWGGNQAITCNNLEDSVIEDNFWSWQAVWGLVLGGAQKNVQVRNNYGGYIGLNEAFRVGNTFNQYSTIEDLTVEDNHWERCGWIAGISGQNNMDIYCSTARNVTVIGNTSVDAPGGFLEMKKASDSTTNNQYTGLVISDNISRQYSGHVHIALRHDPSGNVPTDPRDKVIGPVVSGNTLVDNPYSYIGAPAVTNILSVISGSNLVTVTHTAHWGQTGDLAMIRGVLAPIGGIPPWDIMTANTIVRTGVNTYTIECKTVATGTAAGGTGAILYELFDTPVEIPNGLSVISGGNGDITVALPNHNAVAQDTVDIAGAVGIGSLDASQLNRRFLVRTIVDANNFTIQTSTTSSSAATNAGGADVTARLNKRGATSYGVWLQSVDNAIVDNNTFENLFDGVLLDSNVQGASVEPLVGPKITNNTHTGGYTFAVFTGGIIDRATITNNIMIGFGQFMGLSSEPQIISKMFVQQNVVRIRNGVGVGNGCFASLRCVVTAIFSTNSYIGDARGIYIQNNTTGQASGNNRISRNDFKIADPNFPDVVAVPYSCYRTDSTSTTAGSTQVDGNRFIPGGGVPSIELGSGVSATYTIAYNNTRGATAAIPTYGGYEGDFVYCVPAATGQLGWQCTTTGGSGSATWTAR